ncbi:hypothetical protein CCR94_19485 [Rhodoblastus sphagnicola]|uniref:Outer membrane protein beta-barrel domain-containing protein n=1 Tax=Rhodoblastus sphagnicola TaxID=333368 RepID=A0A2S6MZ82_9HYPH|nr:outer membrane beta-barrel protein [Rhodoblastus sphagnicola]MBB4198626.1 opacity protein-like surface antigen [Rhodoblastus sphagnicola]PPQ27658.1 hypothetical protein CCR94_19485 [Rhodoblastus sphagnicola]
MGRFKALTLASVLALGAAQAAQAADLLPPPPPLEEPSLRGAVIDEPSGFYLRGDIGVGINDVSSRSSTFADPATMSSLNAWYGSSEASASYLLGIGGGYKVNNWFRVDATGEYRGNALYKSKNYYTQANSPACVGLPSGTCGDKYSGSVNIGLFLLNAYLDAGTWYGVTPYIGAGVGAAAWSMGNVTDQSMQVQVAGNQDPIGSGVSDATSGVNLAWALMGGLSWDVAENVKIDLGYRYVDMGRINTGTILCNATCWYERQHFDLASSDVRLGLRWMAAAAPAFEPLPVRAKY